MGEGEGHGRPTRHDALDLPAPELGKFEADQIRQRAADFGLQAARQLAIGVAGHGAQVAIAIDLDGSRRPG